MIEPRKSSTSAHAEDALVRRVGNDHEVILTRIEVARRRPFAEHAHHRELVGAHAHRLPDGIDALLFEQQLVARCGRARRRCVRCCTSVPLRNLPGSDRNARALCEILRRAEHEHRPGLLVRVEDAPLGRGTGSHADLDVDDTGAWSPAPRVRGRPTPSDAGRLISSENSRPLAKLVTPNR